MYYIFIEFFVWQFHLHVVLIMIVEILAPRAHPSKSSTEFGYLSPCLCNNMPDLRAVGVLIWNSPTIWWSPSVFSQNAFDELSVFCAKYLW